MLFLLIFLVVSGCVLTYNQVQNDKEINLLSEVPQINFEADSKSVLDTLKFLVDPAYEYCELSCEKSVDSKCDVLKKTIVSIDHNGLESIEGVQEMSRLPANTSINLMLETYSVSRRIDSCQTTYFVTVESFDTQLENLQQSIDADISASHYSEPNEHYEIWRSGRAEDLLIKYTSSQRPY